MKANVVKILKGIAGEENVHVGQFLQLLHHLALDEQKFYDEAYREVEKEKLENN